MYQKFRRWKYIRKKPNHWVLIRDVALLQLKLIFSGLRDFMLVPLSLCAALVSLLKKQNGPGSQFYDLMQMGRRSDRWINLFGSAERLHGHGDDLSIDDIDEIISRIELYIADEYSKGNSNSVSITQRQLKSLLEMINKNDNNRKRR